MLGKAERAVRSLGARPVAEKVVRCSLYDEDLSCPCEWEGVGKATYRTSIWIVYGLYSTE